MKAKHIIFALASVAVLASCGGNKPAGQEIKKEDALARFNNVAQKLEKGETKLPTKYTMTMDFDIASSNYKGSTMAAIDPEGKYYHVNVTMEGKEGGVTYKVAQELWFYKDGEKFIVALAQTGADGSTDTRYMEVAESFLPQVEQQISSMGASAGSFVKQFLQSGNQVLTTDFGSLIGVGSSLPEGVVVDKNNVSEKFYSTGEGNLSAIIDVDIKAHDSKDTNAVSGKIEMYIDNFLPSSVAISYTLAQNDKNYTNGTNIAFKWNQVSQDKPDLSKFTPAN